MLTVIKNNLYEGFTMTFSNGYAISLQFGSGNYCSRNDKDKAISAEIGIWDKDATWYNFGSDNVKGHCSPDEIVTWMRKVKECEYTGGLYVAYDEDREECFRGHELIYVYESEQESREDCWGDNYVPRMVKDLPGHIKEKVLTQEFNRIIL